MLNTHWILEEDMRKVSQYREMEARIIQIEREWISVPFHWSAQQLAHVEAVSLAFQAIAQAEIDWRLKQYSLFFSDSQTADTPELAEINRKSALTYWAELTEWRHAAADARMLVQRVERGVKVYAEYQASENEKHAEYLRRVGIAA